MEPQQNNQTPGSPAPVMEPPAPDPTPTPAPETPMPPASGPSPAPTMGKDGKDSKKMWYIAGGVLVLIIIIWLVMK